MNISYLRIVKPLAMPNQESARWNPWTLVGPTFIVALSCLAIMSSGVTAAWELDRAAVASGQWWRLITGHLTHWNFDHLFWDAATFLVLSIMCLRRRPAATIGCVMVGSLAISAVVLGLHPDLTTYRGLSGLDTALFTLLAVMFYHDARRDGDRALAAVAKWGLAALTAKTAYELATGDTLFVNSRQAGFVPLASAHAVGAVIGFMAAVAPTVFSTLCAATSRRPPRLLAFPST
jgi:rhomboid family GlyGly-CTERM serine protease